MKKNMLAQGLKALNKEIDSYLEVKFNELSPEAQEKISYYRHDKAALPDGEVDHRLLIRLNEGVLNDYTGADSPLPWLSFSLEELERGFHLKATQMKYFTDTPEHMERLAEKNQPKEGLPPVFVAESGNKYLLGRDLYKAYGATEPYEKWMENAIKSIEALPDDWNPPMLGEDFLPISVNGLPDHALTPEIAMEIIASFERARTLANKKDPWCDLYHELWDLYIDAPHPHKKVSDVYREIKETSFGSYKEGD